MLLSTLVAGVLAYTVQGVSFGDILTTTVEGVNIEMILTLLPVWTYPN